MMIKLLAKLSPSGRNALFYAFVAIVGIAMHNWVLDPQLTYLKAVEQLGPISDKINETKSHLQEQLAARQAMVDKMTQEYSHYSAILYTPEQMSQLESDIRNLAGLVGCEVLTWTQSSKDSSERNAVKSQGLKDIGFQGVRVELNGSYNGILSLLGDLQRDFDGLGIQHMKITQCQDDIGLLHCSFDLDFYVNKQSEVLTDEKSTDH